MVQLVTTSKDLINSLLGKKEVGFVPTMGNLHEGHLSLIEKSISENEHTVVSIFVNPTQFSEGEDFSSYPRTIEQDLEKINNISRGKKVYVFSPETIEEVYPPNYKTTIKVPELENTLCGVTRPTHFEGVCTVVHRLFTIVGPTNAYFGEKDYQQLKIIETMTRNLLPQINIRSVPISREKSGLALSSRNNYFSPSEKKEAIHLNTTLQHIKKRILNNWQVLKKESYLIDEMKVNLNRNNILLNWDYLSILDAETLKEIDNSTTKILIAGALYINKVRIIDNIVIRKEQTC